MEDILKAVHEIGLDVKTTADRLKKDITDLTVKAESQLKENGKISEDLQGQIKGLSDKFDEQDKTVQELATKMNRGGLFNVPEIQESFKSEIEGIVKSLVDTDFGIINGEIRTFNLKGGGEVGYCQKAVGDMSNANLDGVAARTMQNRVVYNPENPVHLRNLVSTFAMSTSLLEYPQEVGSEGAVASQIEGEAKAQMDFDIEIKEVRPITVAVYTTITKQALSDIPFISNYIATRLRDKVLNFEDYQIISGNGTTGQLNGLASVAGASTATGNSFDKIGLTIAELEAAYFSNATVLINPVDYMTMLLNKTTANEYTHPALVFGNGGYSLYGSRILKNGAINKGTAIVGDLSQVGLGIREGLNLAVSYEHDKNFTTNKVTFRVEERIALAIYNALALKLVTLSSSAS